MTKPKVLLKSSNSGSSREAGIGPFHYMCTKKASGDLNPGSSKKMDVGVVGIVEPYGHDDDVAVT